jgi:excisionase family DNA binding protein
MKTVRNSAPATPASSILNVLQPVSVDLKGAAQLTGVSVFTVREAVGNGSLAAKRAGRSYVIKVGDLQRWIDSLDAAPLVPCFVRRQQQREATGAA